MNIETINRATANKLHAEMTSAMREVAARYGLEVKEHGGRFSATEYSTKYTMVATPKGKSAAQVEFETHCRMYMLKPEHFGATFTDLSGKKFKVVGCRPKARKNTIVVENTAGKRWVMPHKTVWNAFNYKAPAITSGRAEKEIMEDIKNVYCSLSPENLSWDGERPMAGQKRAARELTTKLHNLFTELGRSVSETEAYRM